VSKDEILNMLLKVSALMEGHFLLTSGMHSDKYVQCAKLLQYPQYAEAASKAIAEQFRNRQIDVVLGPAMGGITLSYEVARQLGTRAIFAERKDGIMQLRRGFKIEEGENVLIVEDVVTTGGSVSECISIVKSFRGKVVGVSSIIDRGPVPPPFSSIFKPLIKLKLNTYHPNDCPLCKKGIKLQKPGSR